MGEIFRCGTRSGFGMTGKVDLNPKTPFQIQHTATLCEEGFDWLRSAGLPMQGQDTVER